MSTEKKTCFLPEDFETAHTEVRSVWVDRHGHVFLDERTARWSGATHVPCQGCQTPVEKGHAIRCAKCQERLEEMTWGTSMKAAWDGICLLYSEKLNLYFDTPEEVWQHAERREQAEPIGIWAQIFRLRLYLTEPNYASQIDSDLWADDMAEDGELPSAMADAVDALNEAIKAAPPLSWTPSKVGLDLNATWRF